MIQVIDNYVNWAKEEETQLEFDVNKLVQIELFVFEKIGFSLSFKNLPTVADFFLKYWEIVEVLYSQQ